MRRALITTLTLSAFLIIGGFFSYSKVYAIPISPDKYFVEVSANETITEELTIYGREQLEAEKSIYITAVGMRKVGEEHAREFYIPDVNDTTEPANWITLSQTQSTLGAGETLVIEWSMTPSEFAGCGTNLAAIMVSTEPLDVNTENGESVVSFRKEVISQIHMDVLTTPSGQCPDNSVNLELLDYYIDRPIAIFNYAGVPFVVRIENKGNLIAKQPQGFIEVFGFGDKGTIGFNDENLDIYPGTIRRFDYRWQDENYPESGNVFSKMIYELTHIRIGRYEARLGVTKNVNPQIVKSIYFWVIPWKVILLLLGIVLTITYFFLRSRKAEKELRSMKAKSRK